MSKLFQWLVAIGAACSACFTVAADLPIRPLTNSRVQVAAAPISVSSAPLAIRVEAPAPDTLPIKQVKTWVVRDGDRLRSVVQAWAERANWQMLWTPTEVDLLIRTGRTCYGELVDAMPCLFDSIAFERVDPKNRVRAELHTENTPPLVLILRDQGTKQ